MNIKLKITLLFTLAFLIMLSVPVFFIGFSSSVFGILTGPLGIRVNPDIAGGEVMAVFNDEYFDDNGAGNYVYPQADVYKPYRYHLDLLKYIVKKPVRKGTWNDYKEFWAVELVMGDLANPLNAPAGFSFPVIYIYISIDGIANGRTDELFRGTNVSFDQNHPWQFCVKVHGWDKDGQLYNIQGEAIGKALVDIIHDDRLRITMPLINELNNISEKTISYHYIMIGNYDPIADGNLRTAISQKSQITDHSPNIYDYLAPAEQNQNTLLSGYYKNNNQYTILKPVEVANGTGLTMTNIKQKISKDDQRIYENKKSKKLKEKIQILNDQLHKSPKDDEIMTELAILHFQAGDNVEAENLFKELLVIKGKDNPVALAYLGAITAQKASSENNVLKRIEYVNESISLLDKAKALIDYNSPDAIHVLMCRGNVYTALPDNFNKREEAINDLEKLSGMLPDGTLDEIKTDALILLGDNYSVKRRPKRALDKYHEALRIAGNNYFTQNIREKISSAENLFLETIQKNF